MSRRFDYILFGLNIRSEMPLPELYAASPASVPDVIIEYGDVPGKTGELAGLRAIDDGATIAIEGVARYAILGGAHIIVEREAEAAEQNIRLYLLGSVIGMLLHQRGLLPLHANAVEIDGHAVAFMGPSGAGKSTLAAWFHDHGHRVLADDVCVVRFDEQGTAVAEPGLPRLRLCPASLQIFGREADHYERSYVGDPSYEKYDVPVAQDQFAIAPRGIAAIYVLTGGDALNFVALKGAEAVEVLFANTYRGSFLSHTDSARSHWTGCVHLAESVPVFRLERQWSRALLDDQARDMLAHARRMTDLIVQPG